MLKIVHSVDELNESLKTLEPQELIACDLEASELDTRTAKIEGIGYGTNTDTYFIPFPNGFKKQDVADFLKKLFEKTIIFHNAKYDMQLLLENELPIPQKFHDTMIMSWLIDENAQHGLKPRVKEIFGKETKKWTDLNREQDLFRGEEDIMQELAEYCGEDVVNTYDLYFHFKPLLETEGSQIAYERVELKIIPVLMHMEMRGIKVDVSWLLKKQKDAVEQLNALMTDMQKLLVNKVGTNVLFNLRSPQQIEKILFDILGYEVTKETEKGKKSTDTEVLEDLVKKHKLTESDFVPMLLKFRDLDKVHATYLVALAEQAGLENTIHANFKQHGTRTGRLSSNDPNMQNIPSRNDEWNVRSAFIPRKGYKFLQADYSQIELRILAHFSRDANMVNTFVEGGDIHAKTMQVTGANRHTAKAINFGLVYGMGPRRLAHTLGIKEEEAKRYINKFFAGYPAVRSFIERIQRQALATGYTEMITGRKRHFHEFKDNRWYNEIARQSINTKIQGSAADLIKVAMIKLDPVLNKLGAFQLLQIHDEIIIEVPEDKIEEVKKVIKDVMENALQFRVPLVVNIIESDRWTK